MVRLSLLCALLLAGCGTPGTLGNACKDDGTCVGALVCRPSYGGWSKSYRCDL